MTTDSQCGIEGDCPFIHFEPYVTYFGQPSTDIETTFASDLDVTKETETGEENLLTTSGLVVTQPHVMSHFRKIHASLYTMSYLLPATCPMQLGVFDKSWSAIYDGSGDITGELAGKDITWQVSGGGPVEDDEGFRSLCEPVGACPPKGSGMCTWECNTNKTATVCPACTQAEHDTADSAAAVFSTEECGPGPGGGPDETGKGILVGSGCFPHMLGDGVCDSNCFSAECDYDFGDCAEKKREPLIYGIVSLQKFGPEPDLTSTRLKAPALFGSAGMMFESEKEEETYLDASGNGDGLERMLKAGASGISTGAGASSGSSTGAGAALAAAVITRKGVYGSPQEVSFVSQLRALHLAQNNPTPYFIDKSVPRFRKAGLQLTMVGGVFFTLKRKQNTLCSSRFAQLQPKCKETVEERTPYGANPVFMASSELCTRKDWTHPNSTTTAQRLTT